jgi:hypothetical protein
VQPTEITEILNRPTSQELLARDLTRLARRGKIFEIESAPSRGTAITVQAGPWPTPPASCPRRRTRRAGPAGRPITGCCLR